MKQETTHKISDFYRLIDHQWYIQEFNATPALLNMGGPSAIHTTKRFLGYGYSRIINFYSMDFGPMYYDRADLHHMADNFMERYKKDKKYLIRLTEMTDKAAKPMWDYIRYKLDKIRKFQTPKLLDEYRYFSKLVYNAFGPSHLIEGISLTTDVKMKDMLLKVLDKKGLKHRFTEYFTILTQPIRKFFLTDYNHSLNKIILEIKKDKKTVSLFTGNKLVDIEKNLSSNKIRILMENHIKNFFWIKSGFNGANDLTIKHVISEIKKILTEKDTLEVTPLNKFEDNLKKKNRLIKKFLLPKELVDLIRVTDVVTYWQDDRKINIMTGCWAMDRFIKEISRRYPISHANMRYLLPHEATIENMKNFDNKKLAKRRKGCVVFYEGNTIAVFDGKDYENYRQRMIKCEDGEEYKELSGTCASLGKVIGEVRVCRTPKEIAQFQKGEILVTSMTRPEFVPAMKKAAAIVTDEGGITSHAAVISRELGVPCVIGTNNASRILKDGDLVEVNANHSMIKVIKKSVNFS